MSPSPYTHTSISGAIETKIMKKIKSNIEVSFYIAGKLYKLGYIVSEKITFFRDKLKFAGIQ